MTGYDRPYAISARDDEVLSPINASQLFGRGIGYTDAPLIASVLLSPGSRLWTRDKRLLLVAERLGVAYAA